MKTLSSVALVVWVVGCSGGAPVEVPPGDAAAPDGGSPDVAVAVDAGPDANGVTLDPFGLMGPGSDDPTMARTLIPKGGWDRVVANIVTLDTHGVTPAEIKNMADAGFRITFTARWLPTGAPPATLPADMNLYKTQIGKLLDTYPQITHIVVEDEENALGQFGDPKKTVQQNANDYASMLAAAIDVCHPRGVTVSDGGLISEMATSLAYQDMVLAGDQSGADQFWAMAADAWASKSDAAKKYADGILFLDAIKAAKPDFINFHKYLPDRSASPTTPVGGYEVIAAFFAHFTGLPPICNEWGVRDALPSSVQAAAAGLVAANVSLAVCYASGGGPGGAVSLWGSGGSPAANGQALAAFIDAKY